MLWQGAIFDLDGTILDSMPLWRTLGEEFLRGLGVEPEPELQQQLSTLSLSRSITLLQTRYGVAGTAQEIRDVLNDILYHAYAHTIPPKPGATELIERFHLLGVPMVIATATDRTPVEAALDRLGLLPYFLDIFTCQEIGHGKNRPDIFEAALARLGTEKKRTLVFEDALHAIVTAKRAGFPVCAIADDDSRADQDDIQQWADRYLLTYFEFSLDDDAFQG